MATHIAERWAGADLIYGQAATVQSLNTMASEIAKTDIPVLLVGESGTGKEVYARLIHRLSGLDEASLKKVTCAALDAGRLLAEVREEFPSGTGGAETAARTVYLDGVHELDAACQGVLLSLLPDGEPKGRSGKTVSRFISSTSRNLEKEVEAGRFRRELYFRINGVILRLPPLRERKEDIPLLLEFFLTKHSSKLKKSTPDLSSEARELLISHNWPGNIRELENLAKRIIALGDARGVLDGFRPVAKAESRPSEKPQEFSLKVAARAASRQAERELILKALEKTRWNRKRAASDLQISYKSLLYKIKQTGLEASETEPRMKEG
jgi:two-component system response regulator AtoC